MSPTSWIPCTTATSWTPLRSGPTRASTGDVDGLQLIYAAGFLLLRYDGQIGERDYATLRRALLGIADVMGADGYTDVAEGITRTVLPDLDSFVRTRF